MYTVYMYTVHVYCLNRAIILFLVKTQTLTLFQVVEDPLLVFRQYFSRLPVMQMNAKIM